jgi:hypothetical protein
MHEPAATKKLTATFMGTTVACFVPAEEDLAHLQYYLRDHLSPDPAAAEPDLQIRLETADGRPFTAALGTPVPKQVWTRARRERLWTRYEEFGARSTRPAPVPPFALPPLATRVQVRHGAAVAAPDGSSRALAITGDSGAGKSILVAYLLRCRSWRFISDDLLVLDRGSAAPAVHYYGRPIGVRERTMRLLPWLSATALPGVPCIPTRWGKTWMIRPEALGQCAAPGETARLAWRLHLTRSDAFTTEYRRGCLHIGWDPVLHLNRILSTGGPVEAMTSGGQP